MKVTIKEVAELAGVSFKTVSRVVNEEDGVKTELRERVQQAIKKLNYQPNITARRLRGKSATIGFIYNNPNSNYVITMLHGILATCRKNRYELVVHPCDGNSSIDETYDEIVALTQRSSVAGLVLTPPISESPEIISRLEAAGIKFTRIVSSSEPPEDVERTIYIDDRRAAYQITEHLIRQNHTSISFFNGDPEHHSSEERLDGYKAAMRDNGIPIDGHLIVPGEYTFQSGMQRGKELLDSDNRPTAIFACNDEIAAGTLFAARMQGINVPEQLSIVGFEDSPFSRQSWPSLTTAKQPNDEIAGHATQLLIDILAGPSKALNGKRSLNHGYLPEMIVRESSIPPA